MSEFKQDPKRICRAQGHKLKKPNPHSSFYDDPRNKNKRQCSRCGTWVNDCTQ